MARMLPREAELVLEWTGLPGEESVKRFERSNGLDTALYKTIPLPLPLYVFRRDVNHLYSHYHIGPYPSDFLPAFYETFIAFRFSHLCALPLALLSFLRF